MGGGVGGYAEKGTVRSYVNPYGKPNSAKGGRAEGRFEGESGGGGVDWSSGVDDDEEEEGGIPNGRAKAGMEIQVWFRLFRTIPPPVG